MEVVAGDSAGVAGDADDLPCDDVFTVAGVDSVPRLVLSVLISKKGHFINSENAILGQDGAPTVPLGTDGSYDYASLNAQMLKIKSAFPIETVEE